MDKQGRREVMWWWFVWRLPGESSAAPWKTSPFWKIPHVQIDPVLSSPGSGWGGVCYCGGSLQAGERGQRLWDQKRNFIFDLKTYSFSITKTSDLQRGLSMVSGFFSLPNCQLSCHCQLSTFRWPPQRAGAFRSLEPWSFDKSPSLGASDDLPGCLGDWFFPGFSWFVKNCGPQKRTAI